MELLNRGGLQVLRGWMEHVQSSIGADVKLLLVHNTNDVDDDGPPRPDHLTALYYAEVRMDYLFFGDTKRFDYGALKRLLVGRTIEKGITIQHIYHQ